MAVVGVGWGTDAEPPEHLIQQPWSERHLVDEGEVRRVPVAPPHLLSERFDRRLHGYRFHGSLDRHLDLHAGLCSRHHRHITGDIDDHQPITSTGPNRTNAVTRAIRGGSPNGDLLRPRRRLAGIAVTIALMGGRWMFLAPSNVGGHTTFAEVIGHGMQPKLYSGDLSISRAQSEYRLGDLVVFKVRLHHRNGYVSHRWSVDPIRLAGRPRRLPHLGRPMDDPDCQHRGALLVRSPRVRHSHGMGPDQPTVVRCYLQCDRHALLSTAPSASYPSSTCPGARDRVERAPQAGAVRSRVRRLDPQIHSHPRSCSGRCPTRRQPPPGQP